MRALRLLRLAAVVAFGLLLAAWVALRHPIKPVTTERRQQLTQLFMRQLGRALPVSVRQHGEFLPGPVLLLANHVSWLDIPLLGGRLPLTFLSKAEVRDWPLAGWLAHQAGTLFIRRGNSQGDSLAQALQQHLQQGHALLIFPEGTTSDGRSVRRFHGRLLECAMQSQVPVQPVALHYRYNGQADWQIAPFLGEDDLLAHLLRLLACKHLELHVQALPAIMPVPGQGRQALASACRQAIVDSLAHAPSGVPRTLVGNDQDVATQAVESRLGHTAQ